MIFPYSFRRVYLAAPVNGNLVVQTSGTTDVIQTGQFGFCTAPNGIEGSFISSGTGTTLKLVTGSWHTVDKIAPFYGGLEAPIYSKAIDPRRVTRFIQSLSTPAQQQILSIGWDMSSGDSVGPVFYCGTPYFLRLDFLGSPALRLLNHQIYVYLPAYGGCCGTDCSSGCTNSPVDAASIMLQWSDFMRYGTFNPGIGTPAYTFNTNAGEIPYLTQFFLPAVFVQSGSTAVQVYSATDLVAAQGGSYGTAAQNAAVIAAGAYVPNTSNPASVVAAFQLTGSYVGTNYPNCTFTPSDFFEIEPIFAHASLMYGDFQFPNSFSPCTWNTTINTSVPNMVVQTQAPAYPKGLGEQVIRDLIEFNRYRQEYFADSVRVDSYRMREIENDTQQLAAINRQGYYDIIAIVYNIFRPNNSQAVHDNDQYCELICMPAGTNATTFTNLFQACLTAVGSSVVLEKTNSNGSGI